MVTFRELTFDTGRDQQPMGSWRDKAEEIANCIFKKAGTCLQYVPVTSEIPSEL